MKTSGNSEKNKKELNNRGRKRNCKGKKNRKKGKLRKGANKKNLNARKPKEKDSKKLRRLLRGRSKRRQKKQD